MEKQNLGRFSLKLLNKKEHYPWSGQIELTHRCSLNCIHCYCKGSVTTYHSEERQPLCHSEARRAEESQKAGFFAPVGLRMTQVKELQDDSRKDKELTTAEWKNILDVIQKEGCIWLTFSGGDPLVRDDFLELYSYAKNKGFIITIFTNGYGFTEEVINYLAKSPPFSIEITLNGMTKETYEAITQVRDSFPRVIRNIKLLSKSKIRLILKSNCLKQNKHEIAKIKGWTEDLLGKPAQKKYRFKYDPMIYPRLDGDKAPCNYRLSFAELVELKKQDPDIWKEYQKGLHSDFPDLKRERSFLYRCNSWMQQFFINPYGRLKFCIFSDKFSIDLKTAAFKEGFYRWPAQILSERFKTNSKCRGCSLRAICYHCPARAYLENGDEEAPVPYYCQLAEETAKEIASVASLPRNDTKMRVFQR